jgi:hypothetical protein
MVPPFRRGARTSLGSLRDGIVEFGFESFD